MTALKSKRKTCIQRHRQYLRITVYSKGNIKNLYEKKSENLFSQRYVYIYIYIYLYLAVFSDYMFIFIS